MIKTYSNLLRLAQDYQGELNYNLIANKYQEKECPILFAYMFTELYPLMVSVVNKYFNLTDCDKASFCLEELHKCLNTYDEHRKTKFTTLFTTFLNNRLRAETEMTNHKVRKLNYESSYIEDLVSGNELITFDFPFNEQGYEVIEIKSALHKMNLTKTELEYCELILENSSILDSHIAGLIGISAAGIHYIKKSLAKKLNKEFLFA